MTAGTYISFLPVRGACEWMDCYVHMHHATADDFGVIFLCITARVKVVNLHNIYHIKQQLVKRRCLMLF